MRVQVILNRAWTCLHSLLRFLGSTTLTVWFLVGFILYYLTYAIWSQEAFSRIIQNVSSHNFFRLLYLLFLTNITLQIILRTRYNLMFKSAILRLPLHAGIILFLLFAFLSLNIRKTQWILVGQGYILRPRWEKMQFTVVKLQSALEKKFLRSDDLKVFDYEPILTIADQSQKRYKIGAFPYSKISKSYMHILNFGIAPGIEILSNNTTWTYQHYALNLMPMGTVDTFKIPETDYRVYLNITPNKQYQHEGKNFRSYDMEKPVYEIRIEKGGNMVFQGESDTEIKFDDSMSLRFHNPSHWAMIEAVYDPILPGIVIALVLVVLGAILYLFSFLQKFFKWGMKGHE